MTDHQRYFAAHSNELESALAGAINDVIDEECDAPLLRISTIVAHQAICGDGGITAPCIGSLRRFVCESEEIAQEARRRLSSLQDSGHSTSRAGYLKALSEIIGPDPRPSGWQANDTSWQASWRDDWRRMYAEYEGISEEPAEGWAAVEDAQATKFAKSIRRRVDQEGWSLGAATTYTWLSAVSARNPMARAMLERSAEYATATYALYSSLARCPPRPPSCDGEPSAYRNLTGLGSLVESDPAWARLETPDNYGFCGLTSAALVRPTFDERYFDERGFLAQTTKGGWRAADAPSMAEMKSYENEYVPSDIVGFVNEATDEHGIHAALEVGKTSAAFPPNTLFRLKKILAPGEWVAPGGVRPRQRLLVVTCTFRLSAETNEDGGSSKVCDAPTTLTYGAREMYVHGLSDVLDKPLLSLKEEWTRPMSWSDRAGRTYTLRAEWDYVNARVPDQPIGGGGMGVRDGSNGGRSPVDFLTAVNAHVNRQRASHPECCGLPEDGAHLTLDEVIAVRLYTGPGYQPLNDFLRQLGKLTGVVREGVAGHAGLTFTATTALLCSAIRKLAAVTSPGELEQPLYRAVRGELPRAFWLEDKQGMICAVDAGFMSTSKNRATPIHYMGGAANVLWELAPSGESDMAYHRGASVEMISQFAGEEEVLFPPCTMLVVAKEGTKDGTSAEEDGAARDRHAGPGGAASRSAQADRDRGTGIDAPLGASCRASNRNGEPVDFVVICVRPFFV